MPETPRYPTLPTLQELVFDSAGVHVGYRVAVKLQKGTTVHEEAEDVVVGAAQAADLAAGSIEAFTAWNKAQVEALDLVAKANAALDAL